MGNYTRNLFKNKRNKSKHNPAILKLTSCAIIKDGTIHSGCKTHYDLRSKLNYEDPYKSDPDDIEGFMTSNGSFVDRTEAARIAYISDQTHGYLNKLQSDQVLWWHS